MTARSGRPTVSGMEIESLAYRTDLALLELAGSEIEDHGSHIAVRTPDNPGYWWGNFLLFPAAPTREDLNALEEAGLDVEASTVMTATAVHEPPRPNRDAAYRPLATDADWAQQVALTLAGGDPGEEDFVVAKTASQRRTVAAGEGTWWGAFEGDRLLSSMGLFRASPGLCRFQEVKTHPEARGRGLAGTLVHAVSRVGFEELGASTLVMVADPDYLAIRVYRAVGFEDSETQLGAERKPA